MSGWGAHGAPERYLGHRGENYYYVATIDSYDAGDVEASMPVH